MRHPNVQPWLDELLEDAQKSTDATPATSPKPVDSPELIASYEHQLCTYAYILEERYGKRAERLLLYWTSEPRKEDALMEFPYRPELVEKAGRYFEGVVRKIKSKDFRVTKMPESNICKECDLRLLCQTDGTIAERARK